MPNDAKKKPKKVGKKSGPYCGINKVPNGMHLGTPGQCANLKQVRYYGKVAIDPEILLEALQNKGKILSAQQLAGKLQSLILDRQDLVKSNAKLGQSISLARERLADPDITAAQRKKYEKKVTSILNEGEKLSQRHARLNEQIKNMRNTVKHAEELEEYQRITKTLPEDIRQIAEMRPNVQKIIDDTFAELERLEKGEIKKINARAKAIKKKNPKVPAKVINEVKNEAKRVVRKDIEKIAKQEVNKIKKGRAKNFNCNRLTVPWRKRVCKYNEKYPNLTNAEARETLRLLGRLHN